MVRFHTLTSIAGARLWIFRDRTPQTSSENAHDAQDLGPDAHGFRLFQDQLDHQVHEVAHAMLHDAGWKAKEKDAHIRTLPRAPGHFFPSDLWLVEGTQRVLESDPLASARSQVRVHLVLAGSYAGGTLFTWTRGGVAHTFEQTGVDADGPYFDVTLAGGDQSFVCFKFRDARGKDEPDSANRLWVASDGGEIWVFSGLTEIMSARPVPGSLRLRLFDFGAPVVPELHLWRDGTALADLSGTRRGDGWVEFTLPLHTGPRIGSSSGTAGRLRSGSTTRPRATCSWTQPEPLGRRTATTRIVSSAPKSGHWKATTSCTLESPSRIDVWSSCSRRVSRAHR